MSKLQFEFTVRSICDILQDETIQIPEHQRPEMWQPKRQEALIETIMSGRPMPNITVRFEVKESCVIHWLEDGQQRYISMNKFYNNKLLWCGRFYKDLTEMEKVHYSSYKVSVLVYKNATIDEAIQIFDDFQNGVALTPGQRFHARLNTRLVSYARQRFLTSGYFHNRMTTVFGLHNCQNDTKAKKNLTNAMALAGGVAHGVNFLTTSYDVLGPKLNDAFDEALADMRVDKLLRVFEAANEVCSCTLAQKKKMWPVGYITGYVLATLLNFPDNYAQLTEMWAAYLVDMREGVRSIHLLHHNMPASRNWNSDRWMIGYNNIVAPPPDFDLTSNDTDESE